MSAPGYFDDGDFSKAQQTGAPEITFPFSDAGDNKTFQAKVNLVVNVLDYQPPQTMTQRWFRNLGRAYLLRIESPKTVQQGLMEFSLVYGNVPQNRTEYGSVTYAIQTRNGDGTKVSSIIDVYDGDFLYEYSVGKQLPQIFYNRLSINASGDLISIGNSSSVDSANRKLAQNTSSKLYGGRVFERLSVFANVPTIVGISPP